MGKELPLDFQSFQASITTEMLRKYLVEYQTINNCGKGTIDNMRRSLSTFFSWLEE